MRDACSGRSAETCDRAGAVRRPVPSASVMPARRRRDRRQFEKRLFPRHFHEGCFRKERFQRLNVVLCRRFTDVDFYTQLVAHHPPNTGKRELPNRSLGCLNAIDVFKEKKVIDQIKSFVNDMLLPSEPPDKNENECQAQAELYPSNSRQESHSPHNSRPANTGVALLDRSAVGGVGRSAPSQCNVVSVVVQFLTALRRNNLPRPRYDHDVRASQRRDNDDSRRGWNMPRRVVTDQDGRSK
jgi:hypothetical protein